MMSSVSPAQSIARPAGSAFKPEPSASSIQPQRPAAIAAGRAFGVSLLLGGLATASTVLVITRLFESWRVTAGPTSHTISAFGQRLSYPVANTGAVVVTALAGLGLAMAGAAAWRAARELLADRKVARAIGT